MAETYKIWVSVEEHDDETEKYEDIDLPFGGVAEFVDEGKARLFAKKAHKMLKLFIEAEAIAWETGVQVVIYYLLVVEVHPSGREMSDGWTEPELDGPYDSYENTLKAARQHRAIVSIEDALFALRVERRLNEPLALEVQTFSAEALLEPEVAS